MKKFEYRLDTVLDYKTQVLDNLKTEHAVIVQKVNRKQEEIQGLNRKLAGYEDDFNKAKEQGVSIGDCRQGVVGNMITSVLRVLAPLM